ncbi:hypothetical protein BSKO_11573 [Bryopsis sp. KO-2023]|nr:hypothetical protein BSKO_11573 [Bryopsis sp. KO-2023]
MNRTLHEGVPSLKQCALRVAARSGLYKRQRGKMEMLDGALADALFNEVVKVCREMGDRKACNHLEGFDTCLRHFRADSATVGNVEDWLALIGTFSRVVGVEIRGCRRITDENIIYLGNLVNQLEVVRLKGCAVGCATVQNILPQCSRLTDLDLSGTFVFASHSFSPIENLARLTGLRTLQLEELKLYDKDIVPLKDLTRISHLNLAANYISSDGVEMLTVLRDLEILDLSRTSATTVPFLPKLRVLKMNNCYTQESAHTVSNNLEVLEFNYSEAQDQNGWRFFDRLLSDSRSPLRHVDFGDSTLVDFDFLKQGKGLTFVDVSGTCLEDRDLPHLSDMLNLTDLRLNSTYISNDGIRYLQPLRSTLKCLSLRFCSRIDSQVFPHIAHLTSLTFLNLSNTNVDRIQSTLKNRLALVAKKQPMLLPNLRTLSLMETQWTDAGSDHLHHFCPGLTEIRLSSKSGRVTEESLQKLQHLHHLSRLVFGVEKLNDSGLGKIYWLRNSLRVLDLHVHEGISAHALQWLYSQIGLERVTRNGHLIRKDVRF